MSLTFPTGIWRPVKVVLPLLQQQSLGLIRVRLLNTYPWSRNNAVTAKNETDDVVGVVIRDGVQTDVSSPASVHD